MTFESQIDPRSESFKGHRNDMLEALKLVQDAEAAVRSNSNSKRKKFHGRGQLLPRERLALLLDPNSRVLELCGLAGFKMHDDDGAKSASGGGAIACIGQVEGVRCAIYVHDSAIKGGAVSPMGVQKALRLQEVALENRLPMITLAESAGGNLNYQSELFVPGGRTFANQAKISAAGIPQITVVHGSSTAGGAYVPGLSDYVIMVRKKAKVFLAGPPLVKAAIGEDSDDETLGGADMHAKYTGLAEYLADDDRQAIAQARQVLAGLHWPKHQINPTSEEPHYSPDELCGVVPLDYRKPYDAREVIVRLVDRSEFVEFKPSYGSEILTAHATIGGYPVGIIANNGPIFPDSSVKAAQFIQLCGQSNTPLLFLQNTTGFMVGVEAERNGIVKHGAKFIQAVANATVPKLTLLIGGAFGAGHYAMCGRSYDPRFIFAWPNNRISVMGGDQAAGVLRIITEAKFKKMGMDLNEEAFEAMASQVRQQIDRESTALFGTARLWDDGIIDPRKSRDVLIDALSICHATTETPLQTNTYGVARL